MQNMSTRPPLSIPTVNISELDLDPVYFAKSQPALNHVRDATDIFGADAIHHSFGKGFLLTPREIREKIREQEAFVETTETKREKRLGSNYAIVKRFEEARKLKQLKKEREKEAEAKAAKDALAAHEQLVLSLKSEESVLPDGHSGNENDEFILESKAFERDKYLGDKARKDFFDMYQKTDKNLGLYLTDSDVQEEDKTPRSVYLREVCKRNLPPLSLVLRKESDAHGVHLEHRGLGDLHISPLIEIIEKLPFLDTVDLTDNRLTDETLMPLMLKLKSMPGLTHLNLSDNKIDDSSEVIMEYIKSSQCTLKTLVLNGADVDDNEACNLANAITHNCSISTLELAHNLLGKDEPSAAVNPHIMTGAVALGLMLEVNTTLTKLDVSWNAIRNKSAQKLAKSLKKSSTLKELYLGHNGIGDEAAQLIGKVLKKNTSLRVLDLSYNSLHPKSIAVISHALVHNESISLVRLDGSILGRVGAQSMVGAIQRSSGKVVKLNITFNDCDHR